MHGWRRAGGRFRLAGSEKPPFASRVPRGRNIRVWASQGGGGTGGSGCGFMKDTFCTGGDGWHAGSRTHAQERHPRMGPSEPPLLEAAKAGSTDETYVGLATGRTRQGGTSPQPQKPLEPTDFSPQGPHASMGRASRRVAKPSILSSRFRFFIHDLFLEFFMGAERGG